MSFINFPQSGCILVMIGCLFLLNIPALGSEFITPDKETNQNLRSGDIDVVSFFGISENKSGFVINPTLEKDWTWLAAKDLLYGGTRLNFFFYDGWLFTDRNISTQHRRQKYQRNVTEMITSNVFTLAFYSEKGIEKELVIFISTESETTARLHISKDLWGEGREITYHLDAGEAHFISLLMMADEYRPLYVEENSGDRMIVDMNSGWRFSRGDHTGALRKEFDESTWEEITLPHSWNARDVYDTRNIFDGYEEYHGYYRGPGWYRKVFTLDESTFSRGMTLEFEGANQVAEVWLNEKYLGQNIGGYTGFKFNISDHINYGTEKNLLAVRVDNSYSYDIPPHTADFIMYGGIYRDVRLILKDRTSIKDVIVTSPVVSDRIAETTVITSISNTRDYEVKLILKTNIVNSSGEIVSTSISEVLVAAGATVKIKQALPPVVDPRLWSPDQPYLYNIISAIYIDDQPIDQIKTNYGYRWFRFDPQTGFYLNGRHLKLKGVNKHQDFYGLGNAVPDSLQIRDIEIIKQMGANFIRLSHYPHDPSVLDACNRLGLLVWEEIPLVNTVGGESFAENCKQMLGEMINRDINHPSIILWGITNESAMPFTNYEQVPVIIRLLRDLHDQAKAMDPSRMTVQAHNHFKDISLAEITDVIGRNRYFGWYEGVFEDFAEVMEKEHAEHPLWNIIISEFGVGSKRGYHVEDPEAFDFSEEYQLDFHEYYWQVINDRPWIAGGAVWNMFDFGSFVKVGNIPRVNQKGLCDFERRPKDAFYFYQSQWSGTPMVYIVSHTKSEYNGARDEAKDIHVYSNCDEVDLKINGQSLGKQTNQYVFHWNVLFKPGRNVLKAIGTVNGQTVQDEIVVAYTINED